MYSRYYAYRGSSGDDDDDDCQGDGCYSQQ